MEPGCPDWLAKGKLGPDSRAELRRINLHFHDLRRQFASTLLESGADLHDVSLFLGHAAITTTSRYLQSTPLRLEKALQKMEGAGFAHGSHTATEEAQSGATETTPSVASNLLK